MNDNFEEIIKQEFNRNLCHQVGTIKPTYILKGNLGYEDFMEFLLHALKQQRRKDAEEFERMIGEDQDEFTHLDSGDIINRTALNRNELRRRLRKQLEEFKK